MNKASPLATMMSLCVTIPFLTAQAMEISCEKEVKELSLIDIPLLLPIQPTDPFQDIDLLSVKLCLDVFRKYSLWYAGHSLDWPEEFRLNHISGLTFDHPPLPEAICCSSKSIFGHYSWSVTEESQESCDSNDQKEFFGTLNFHKKENLISIAFRGSQNFNDFYYHNLYVDAKFPKKYVDPLPRDDETSVDTHDLSYDGLIHSGIYNRVMTFKDQLLKDLRSLLLEAKQPQLIITGHSLGGATACILAGMIAEDKDLCLQFSQIYLRPFAAYRVSDSSFGRWLQERKIDLKHHVRETDPVPNTPNLHSFWEGPNFEDICERTILDSFQVPFYRIHLRHDIRLYWVAMAKKAGVLLSSFPLYQMPLDHDNVIKLLKGETDVYEGNWWEFTCKNG